jgi:hypothetical protein
MYTLSTVAKNYFEQSSNSKTCETTNDQRGVDANVSTASGAFPQIPRAATHLLLNPCSTEVTSATAGARYGVDPSSLLLNRP